MILNPAAATAGQPAEIPQRPFALGAKSQKRLKAAIKIMQYYSAVGRELTPASVKWSPVIFNFIEHWKALKD
jgi:hypothetical protein